MSTDFRTEKIAQGDKTMTEKTANKTDMSKKTAADPMTKKQWLAIRKEAGLQIDPETAEVRCIYTNIFDPYGIYHLRDVCLGTDCFARAPGSNIWVLFRDLPDETRRALEERPKRREDPDDLEGPGDIPF
jgi:hypothetical protein